MILSLSFEWDLAAAAHDRRVKESARGRQIADAVAAMPKPSRYITFPSGTPDAGAFVRRRLRGIAHKFSLGFLAASLAITTVLPAVAADSYQQRRAGEPRQEREISGEARGKGKKKGNKTRTVKKTFSDGGVIAVPAVGSAGDVGPADPYPSTIDVGGFKKARITDVNLTLREFRHAVASDVDVLLVSGEGRDAVVLSNVGGFTVADNVTLTLDDEAAASLPTGNLDSLSSGAFRPTNLGEVDAFPAPAPVPSGNVALSTFDGGDPNGDWRLFVVDDGNEDVGTFAGGWTLEITAKVKAKSKNKNKNKKKH